jgi:hypothetical protein
VPIVGLRARRIWFRRSVLAVVVLAVVAAGCGGDSADTTVAAGDVPSADELLQASGAAMQEVRSLRFGMQRSGAPVEVTGLEFVSALGDYAAPDSAQTLLEMKTGDISAELGSISIGATTWLTNPLTGEWEELPEGSGFNPASIFDPETGIQPLLAEGISDARVTALDGDVAVIEGVADAQRVEVITVGLVEAQEVDITASIDLATFHLLRAEFSTMGEEGVSDWVLVLSAFDEPVTIEPPATDG